MLFLAMVAMARVPRAEDAYRHRDATWTASRASPAVNASDRIGWHREARPPLRSGEAAAAVAALVDTFCALLCSWWRRMGGG